jgi:phage terminase small subunit
MALTEKQRRFVAEYLIDLNATQAAIRAGYSEKTAGSQGFDLLKKPEIADAIHSAMQDRAERTEITQDRVLAELAKLGFADIRKAVKWGDGIAVTDPESGAVTISNGVALVGSEEIDDDTAACISEVSQTAQGIKIKMHDKRAALVDIGRHLGMFTDKTEITGKDGGPVQVQRIERTIIDPK